MLTDEDFSKLVDTLEMSYSFMELKKALLFATLKSEYLAGVSDGEKKMYQLLTRIKSE